MNGILHLFPILILIHSALLIDSSSHASTVTLNWGAGYCSLAFYASDVVDGSSHVRLGNTSLSKL